jgi:hypothetical protein
MFADVRGCSHLTELLFSLPTAAIQTFATFRRDNEDEGKTFQLDRCHAWKPPPTPSALLPPLVSRRRCGRVGKPQLHCSVKAVAPLFRI